MKETVMMLRPFDGKRSSLTTTVELLLLLFSKNFYRKVPLYEGGLHALADLLRVPGSYSARNIVQTASILGPKARGLLWIFTYLSTCSGKMPPKSSLVDIYLRI